MKFDGTEKTIGHGAQAEVLLYHGFAYKIYKPSYPAEWISFEIETQKTVNKAGLSQAFRQIHAADPSGTKIPSFLLTIETMLTAEDDFYEAVEVSKIIRKHEK